MPIIKCSNCEKEKYYSLSVIQKGYGKYCSRKCTAIANLYKLKKRTCNNCRAFKSNKKHICKPVWNKGKKCPWAKFPIMKGANNPAWKGDKVGYVSLHRWVRQIKGTPVKCVKCGQTKGILEWSNISHIYKREIDDWETLCISCHRKLDAHSHAKAKYFNKLGHRIMV